MGMNMLLIMSFVRYLSGWEPIRCALNISKTKFMVFHTSNRSVTYPVLQMDRRPIERVAQFNFLVLILQSTWHGVSISTMCLVKSPKRLVYFIN